MKNLSHNLAALEIKETLPDFYAREEILTAVQKTLHLVERKEICASLNISESLLSQWINHDKPIPSERMFQIIRAGKLFCQQIQNFENEIDMMLMLNFGRKIED